MLRTTSFIALLSAALAAPAADEVTSLPRYSGNLPPKSMYAGYLDIQSPEGPKHMHYWMDVAQNDADGKAPVIFWFTGGPGCSSDSAYLIEQGRYHMKEPLGNPEVIENPYAWSTAAHVVFIDSPSGVGYSWAEQPAGLVHNDSSTANDSYHALLAFFAKFPELSDRGVWITGESYAGVYVPMLAQQVVQRGGVNLKGIMVGNGCIGTDVGGCSSKDAARIDFGFLAGNHLISQRSYNSLLSVCNNFSGNPSQSCQDLQSLVLDGVGPVDIYDVYSPCVAFASDKDSATPRLFHAPPSPVDLALGQGPSACFNSNDTTTQYLNLPEVRSALHVAPVAKTGTWSECTDRIQYTPTMPDEPTLVYPDLVDAKLDITIYNGNFDLCVPVNGNEEWTSSFGSTAGGGVKRSWRPWLVDGQVQGYVTEYNGKGGAFRFVTVNAAGHMVPQTQPARALELLNRAMGNAPF